MPCPECGEILISKPNFRLWCANCSPNHKLYSEIETRNKIEEDPNRDQIFYLSNKEAIIINNEVKGNKTVNPLRIRVCDDQTNLDNAILSVMALRLMHFGTTKTPKLPVTISFSDRISGFVRKGITPPYKRGSIPWWY